MEPPTSESYGRRWRTSPPTPSGQPRSFAGCEGWFRKERSEYKRADVNALIVEVMMLLRGELESKGIGVQLSLAKDLPPVLGDAIQLQQVVLNVVLNAAEAMADRSTGRAFLSVETVEHHAGIIEISVRDRGPGVKDIDLERIFEPFVTTKSTGLGMGLSISRSILDAHGGRMWATRNGEHGLTGHIELSHEGRVRDDER